MYHISRGRLPVLTALATVLSVLAGDLALAHPSEATDLGWSDAASRRVRAIEYAFASRAADVWAAPNRAQNLRAQITKDGIEITPRLPGDAPFTLRMGIAAPRSSEATIHASGHRVEIQRAGLVEWYQNDERGLEQGFDVAEKLAAGKLCIAMTLETSLGAAIDADGLGVTFLCGGHDVLRYHGLKAWDANGRMLPARLGLDANVLRIEVDDAAATYPVHIDPVLSGPSWSAESNQAGADFGWQVATAGDVNDDGFSDVIVGAPFFDNGEADEGAAFVFLGSLTGPSLAPSWSTESNQAGASFGWSVAPAGDANGDGFADVVVGARQFDNVETDEGGAFLFTGSISGLSTSPAWSAESDQASGFFGVSVATAGDVNGDGFDDLVIGASLFDNGEADEGRAFLFNGSGTGPSLVADWMTEGDQISALYGISVATAGDVNGDGFAEVLVGAQGYDNGQSNEGRASLFLGSASGPSLTASWTTESDQASAQLGISVATAGDVNGDGFADVVVGAATYDNGQTDEGRAFLFNGSLSGLSTSPSWTTEADVAGAFHGYSVATAGDVDGDGLADVVVGAPNLSNGETLEGRLSVYLGDATGLATTAAFSAESNATASLLGISVATAGDVNGDGYSDVIAGAALFSNGESNEGAAFAYFGAGQGLTATATTTLESDQLSAEYATSVASADVNGDGYTDVIVGAPRFDDGLLTDQGRAFAYFGTKDGLDPVIAWTIEGPQGGARFGGAVAAAGDVNGDGFVDVLVGAQFYDNGQVDEGRAFLFLGSTAGPDTSPVWTTESDQGSSAYSASMASAGDVNGDGFADVIIGAPNYDNGQTNEGRAFVYLGSSTGLVTTPSWTGESDQAFAVYATSVAPAGDVNRDGFSDVIVGAPFYDNGTSNEGRAYLYTGSAAGPSLSPAWTAESDVGSAQFAFSVASAGDVNGDGYSDLIVGARAYGNEQASEGAASVYQGSASGPSSTPAWFIESNQPGAEFGYAVATAGDVNNDGYSDVVVGARLFDNGEADEGLVFSYLGSASGLSTSAAWSTEGGQALAEYGAALASAGDVNGDGFADVVVGSYRYDNGEIDEGRAYVYLGNNGDGFERAPRQFRADDGAAIALYGIADSQTNFHLKAIGRSTAGRARVRLQWEVKGLGQSFDATGLQQGAAFADTGIPTIDGSVVNLDELSSGLTELGVSHWRLRVATKSPFFPWSPWVSLPGNAASEADLRAPDLCGIAFSTFGVGLAGTDGFVPQLTGTGTSCGLAGFTLHITDGLGGGTGLLWAGTGSADYFPAFGGHFYVSFSSPFVRFAVTLGGTPGVGGAGLLDLPSADVTLYQGITIYMQATMVDPAAMFGVSLSNALQLDIVD